MCVCIYERMCVRVQGDIMSHLQSIGMHRIYDIEYIDLENIVLKILFNELEAK